MNPEIKEKWVAALRSGDYEQGKGRLRSEDDKFCCLGVLCDLAEKEGVTTATPPDLTSLDPQWLYGERSTAGLPREVADWAGLEVTMPKVGDIGLHLMNDGLGYDFNQIADIIEKEL